MLRSIHPLLELREEALDETIVCKAIIGVVPDDNVIQDLDRQKLCRPGEIPGETLVLR